MIIKGKTCFVYDLEVFPNLFTCAVKNTESKQSVCYEISDIRNDMPQIAHLFLNKNIIFVGYNNLHYDDCLIAFILMHYKELIQLPIWEINKSIKELSDLIIDSKKDEENANKFNKWSKYKYAHLFTSLDVLAMLFSSKLRVGLKEMQVTMQYPNVREYEGDFTRPVPISDFNNVKSYNFNDVNSTEELLYRCENDIKLRLAIEEEYGIDALNKDGVNLGMEILKVRYLKATGKTWAEIKDLRSPCDKLALKDIIFPFIKFKTKQLQDLLNDLKQQIIAPDDREFERKFIIDGVVHTLSLGGLHSVNKPERFEPEWPLILADSDATSLYPTVIIEHALYPQHLGPEFIDVYKDIRSERVAAKKAKEKLKDATLKLAINGLTGNLQSKFSWCYDPKIVITLRLNCQLMMIMLLEELVEFGCHICQTNTDGILYLVNSQRLTQLQQVFDQWTKTTKIGLETEYFERFYQFAINDYIGVQQGYSKTKDPSLIKKKGLFIDKVSLGRGMAPMIIAKAINAKLVDGVPPEETVYNETDIKQFLTYQKVNKDYEVEYGGNLVRHINRYYMSMNGARLFKCKVDPVTKIRTNYISMCSSGVTILNEFDDIPISKRKINYGYYLTEIYKILNVLETKQLTLF